MPVNKDTKYYVDVNGNYIGAFSSKNVAIPLDAIEVPNPPSHARDKFIDGKFFAYKKSHGEKLTIATQMLSDKRYMGLITALVNSTPANTPEEIKNNAINILAGLI